MWRRWAGRHPTGIDRVCLSYLDRFAGSSQAVVQHPRFRRILDRKASATLFELLAEPPQSFRSELVRGALRLGIRGRSCPGRNRLYLNIGHTGLDDPGYAKWVTQAGVRPVYFVHDLIPITHPEFCRDGEKAKHERRMRTVLGSAAGVIGNSQATLDDLAAFARSERRPNPPAVAAWLGTTPLQPSGSAAAPDRPTFVVLGTIEARKNHLMLLHVWSRIVRKLGAKAPRLLVIGQRGWECEQVVDMLDRGYILDGSVVEVGKCDDAELARHLADARALLFPSLIEGYGLPLVEALSASTPVIASDLPVFREIGQGVPDLLDPLDGPAWEQAILSYAEDGSPARAEQMDRLKTYRLPTWDDHFSAVEAFLDEL